jgi:hypothetical protein
MKRPAPFAAVAAAALVFSAAFAAASPSGQRREREKDSRYKVEEKDEMRQTLKFADPGKPLSLVVDNLHGGIEVQGADVREVELVARKTIRAKTAEKIAAAKKDVELKITGDGNSIDLYVDGPFRCQVQDCPGFRWRDWGYEVHYDFVLKVPKRTNLTLKTVTSGDIAVRDVEGSFDVSNVNGKVALENVAGDGEAGTVNGGVRASFLRVPASNWAFKTINGEVELIFPAGLAADFKFKTMNGEAFSDFAVTPLPIEPAKTESKEGKFVYKRGGFTSVRVGRGGPEIRCDTLNGDILIRKKS